MSDLSHREEIELRLKADLDEAERQLRQSNPQELPEARRRFREALHTFTVAILEGKYPKESKCA